MDTKTCTKCGIEKPVSEFYSQKRKRASGKVYVTSLAYCKPCHTVYSVEKAKQRRKVDPGRIRDIARRSREKHREKRIAEARQWRLDNAERESEKRKGAYAADPEAARAKERAWRKSNPERAKAIAERSRRKNREKRLVGYRAWYAANREKAIASTRRWEKNNPVRAQAVNRKTASNRRAAKLQRTPAWADHEQIGYIYAIAVRVSRETGIEHHVDHIVPLQSELVSGLHCEANLQVIPASENWRKNNSFEF